MHDTMITSIINKVLELIAAAPKPPTAPDKSGVRVRH